MEISVLRELQTKFKQPKTTEEIEEVMEYIRQTGINITDLYQELEMTSTYANIHKDVTHKKANISLHSHSFYEVMLCRAADRVEYLIGSRQYKISAGDIVIIAPGIGHMPIFPDDMQYAYDRDILWVNSEFMARIIELFPGFSIDRITSPILLHTKGTSYSYIGDYFTDGISETLNQKTGYDKIITAHAILIVSHILRAISEGKSGAFESEKPTLINSLIEYIEGHLDSKLNLDDVAAHFYISRGTVNRLFRQSMDTTFYKFVTQRRLILAKVLIAEGESMDSISHKCGFLDYSTFYKSFKKEYGISPREYAKI